jgi:hypothetical protein
MCPPKINIRKKISEQKKIWAFNMSRTGGKKKSFF